jgi:hypothetical protein
MKNKRIVSGDWFQIGWGAYFADKCCDFLIVRDCAPWRVYYREVDMPTMYCPPTAGTFSFDGENGWTLTDIEGKRVERYFRRCAKPETWEEVSQAFMATHDVHPICDGASIKIINKLPNTRRKRLGYMMHSFPDAWHPSYQKACRLLRFLEGAKGAATGGYSRLF